MRSRFPGVYQALMSDKEVTVLSRDLVIREEAIRFHSRASNGEYLRAKDLEQISHEKGFSLVSIFGKPRTMLANLNGTVAHRGIWVGGELFTSAEMSLKMLEPRKRAMAVLAG